MYFFVFSFKCKYCDDKWGVPITVDFFKVARFDRKQKKNLVNRMNQASDYSIFQTFVTFDSDGKVPRYQI